MASIPSSALSRDAADLYRTATGFIRWYQFRDRDQALRSGLTVVQAYTLDILLSAGGQSLTGLALALRLDKSTASRVVTGMTRSGLVSWSRTPEDRRGKLIVATPEGRRRYQRHRQAVVKDNVRLLATHPPAVRRALIDLLEQLTPRAGSAPAPRRRSS